jgi:hypothetical protein
MLIPLLKPQSPPVLSMLRLLATRSLSSPAPLLRGRVAATTARAFHRAPVSTFPRTFHILKSRNYRGDIQSEKKARHGADEKSLQPTSEMVTIVSFALFIVFATSVAQVVGNIG